MSALYPDVIENTDNKRVHKSATQYNWIPRRDHSDQSPICYKFQTVTLDIASASFWATRYICQVGLTIQDLALISNFALLTDLYVDNIIWCYHSVKARHMQVCITDFENTGLLNYMLIEPTVVKSSFANIEWEFPSGGEGILWPLGEDMTDVFQECVPMQSSNQTVIGTYWMCFNAKQ